MNASRPWCSRATCGPTVVELDAHCRELVAGYKVPREVHLVAEIERSPSGKPDYPWAKQVALAGQGSVTGR